MLITAGRMKNGKNQTSLLSLSLSLSLTLPLIFEQKNKRPATPGKTTHNRATTTTTAEAAAEEKHFLKFLFSLILNLQLRCTKWMFLKVLLKQQFCCNSIPKQSVYLHWIKSVNPNKLAVNTFRTNIKNCNDRSPGPVVMGGDSSPRGLEFVSQCPIQDGSFLNLFYLKIVLNFEKTRIKRRRGREILIKIKKLTTAIRCLIKMFRSNS